jgi:hypothetical protein
MTRTKSSADMSMGEEVAPLVIELSTTRIIAGALATGDFEPVHHDRSVAQRYGRQDIFMNIPTVNGLMQRCVTDWAGPDVVITKMRLRLLGGDVPGEPYVIRGKVVGKDLRQRRSGFRRAVTRPPLPPVRHSHSNFRVDRPRYWPERIDLARQPIIKCEP